MVFWFRLIMLLVAFSSSTMLFAEELNSTPVNGGGFKATLRRVDSGGNFTRLERLRRAMNRQLPHQRLAASDDVQSKVLPVSGEFLIQLGIGSPPVFSNYLMDSGSDLIWSTQCSAAGIQGATIPCDHPICGTPRPPFLPCNVRGPSCWFDAGYKDGSKSAQGTMVNAKITFSDGSSFDKVLLGCGQLYQSYANNTVSPIDPPSGSSGIVGIGRRQLSLVSQLNMKQFWYCLTDIESLAASTLVLGSPAGVVAAAESYSAAVTTTPLLPHEILYCISLKGISVGGVPLPVEEAEFEAHPVGVPGMAIDSGATFTCLYPTVFGALRDELIRQVGDHLPVASDPAGKTVMELCFVLPSGGANINDIFPQLTLHLDGGDLVLPQQNYIETVAGLACLAMVSTDIASPSIFGSTQQQNMMVKFDLVQSTVSFQSTQCDQIP
ncbi:unnamed protein product [Cuscuta epithymum]|uniref:Peptidase A1 domain-containing protein n=1 Tax=Cuscuta epithymum TaxID=186058 RepID=A0AAV0F4F3_9ASTE|nr:unnamed protein product [Cuscuta epithymum]